MSVTIDKQGQRIYLTGDTYAIRDRIKALGGHWDGEKRAWWVGAAKECQARKLVESLPAMASPDQPKPKQFPDDIRLTGKGIYKGRNYFLGAYTRDGKHVRCLTLPNEQGEFLDFWANADLVRVVKSYQPREYRGRTVYTSLGSIARFVVGERENKKTGGAVCAECGKSGDLVEDMEDGLMKHRGCCDMPPC
jgi:hypothetical protein